MLTQTLRSGDKMPVVGLGVWKIPRDATASTVEQAINLGYRHLDCACDYGNEVEVGLGIKAAIASGAVKREDIFVTSKLWNTFHAKEHVRPALQRTLADLGLDYLDLYLIHFPISLAFVPHEERYPPEWVAPGGKLEPVDVPLSETWAEMEALHKDGLVRNIGVANFNCQLLRDLLSYAKVAPAVNQVELHPYLTQGRLVKFCKESGVVVTGYSPLGAGSYLELGGATEAESCMREAVVISIAKKHNKTPAQVVLRWGVQRDEVIIPKSVKLDRLKENINLFDFELTADDMTAISGLERNRRFNDPGVYCELAFGKFYPIFE